MGGSVTGEAEVLFALPEDLMNDRRRNACATEAADRQVVPVAHQARDRLTYRSELVRQRPRLRREERPCRIRRRIVEQGTIAVRKGFHERSQESGVRNQESGIGNSTREGD